MIKNRELALIPDSALEMLDPPATAPRPRRRPTRATGDTRPARGRTRPSERPER